jgi:hypothetical protein
VHGATCCCPACHGLECLDRTRFFAGQLLTEADLNNEQSYWLAKSRLHNRFLHGWGVVCGMQVVCSECDGWVTVKTGYAVDPCGNDIIVCTDTPFNVVKAIQDCCMPTKQTVNCSPLRSASSPNCQDIVQTWCIAIQYQEQPSRLVTPLVPAPPQSTTCGCGCGNSHGKHGNGNGHGGTADGCCSSGWKQPQTSSAAATVPAGACEPTRIVEGFQLCLVPPPETEQEGPAPGSLLYQLEQCGEGLFLLLQQAPDLSNVTDVQAAYQATCNYLLAVKQALAKSSTVTHCQILNDLVAIQVPQPSPNTTVAVYIGIVAQIKLLVAYALLDCICYSLLPACAPDPCDNRLILACVTVQDGKIIDICHFTGRKQLITFPVLRYWLGPLGLDNLIKALERILEFFCCSELKELGVFGAFSGQKAFQQESFNSAGVKNSAVLNRIATHYVAQTFGASFVNAMAPAARAVDTRPLVGQPIEVVTQVLESQGFKQVNQQPVDDDPSWTPDAVASASQFAPAAVSAGQPLSVYTKGSVAVGFEVVDPTAAKLQDLQEQINELHNQFGHAQGEGKTPKQPPRKK